MWTNKKVNYTIASNVYDEQLIRDAITHIEENSILNFYEGSAMNYIEFIPSTGCSSYIGVIGGKQNIWIADWANMGNVVHEICHALGVEHEHTRADRNNYIIVEYNNI